MTWAAGIVCFRLREGDAATLVNGRHMSTHGSRGIRSIGYGDHKFPLARAKILHAPVPTIAASGFLSNQLQFGSLFAPVGIELSKGPQGRNMRRERDYRDLASVFLHLATAPPRMAENLAQGCPNASDDKGHRVVVGTIVDCNQMFFLTEELSPHAYVLTNIARVKTFLGRKVRITGALQSPHVLTVETVDELH